MNTQQVPEEVTLTMNPETTEAMALETIAVETANVTDDVGWKDKVGGYWWIILAAVVLIAVVIAAIVRSHRSDQDLESEFANETEPDEQEERRPPVGRRTPSTLIPPRDPDRTPAYVPQWVTSELEESGNVETEVDVEDGSEVSSRFHVGFAQTIGTREDQEDSYAISNWRDERAIARHGILAAVADGVGGLGDGRLASNTLMRSFCNEFGRLDPNLSPSERLLELMARGQREVLRLNHGGRRCGTTLVCALIVENGLSCLSVGDSRIVLYRSGSLLQLNREHTYGRDLDENRALKPEDAQGSGSRRGAITSYIGRENLKQVDRTLNPIQLISGDRVILMSDGVFGALSDDELIAYLAQEPEQAARSIIQAVENRAHPHQDNATIVIVGMD